MHFIKLHTHNDHVSTNDHSHYLTVSFQPHTKKKRHTWKKQGCSQVLYCIKYIHHTCNTFSFLCHHMPCSREHQSTEHCKQACHTKLQHHCPKLSRNIWNRVHIICLSQISNIAHANWQAYQQMCRLIFFLSSLMQGINNNYKNCCVTSKELRISPNCNT